MKKNGSASSPHRRLVGVTVILVLIGLRFLTLVFAETITLKSGLEFEASVVEKTDQYIIVNWQGENIRYSLSEIGHIEGSPSLQKIEQQDAYLPSEPEPSISSKINGSDRQQVLKYVNESGLIMESVKEKILAKQALLAQASTRADMEGMLAITKEMRDTFAGHKQQFSQISVPADCQVLHSTALKWYQLQVDIYNELLKGNVQQSQLLTQQLIECFNKMQQESDRLAQYYE